MNQNVSAFQIAIGPRMLGDAYPVRASAGRSEITSDLLLPAPLRRLAERLPGTSGLPLGDPAELGRALGRALFTPTLRDLLLRSARAAAREHRRMQLQLQIAPPELAALPWEWLTVGVGRAWSPALRDDYTLVRVSRGVAPAAPLALAGPLRVLALAAPGEELQLAALERALAEAVRAGAIELRLLGDATPATLEHGLIDGPVHVLHCAAPVAYTERGAPRLLLRRGMDLFDFAGLLADATQLRLVTLAGPQGDGSSASAALPVLAAALLTPALPATVAFGGALPARLAGCFAAACYAGLAAGQPIDLAVTTGRRALAELGEGRSWGAPQLRMAAGGEQLFVPRRSSPGLARRGALLAGGLALAGALALGGAQMLGGELNALVSGADPRPSPTPALAIGRGAQALAVLPTITPAPPTAEPTVPPTPEALTDPAGYATFLAAPGDTLESIAARMGSEAGAIARINHADGGEALRPERPLVIPVYRAAEPGAGGLVIRRGNPAARKVALTFDIEIDDRTLYQVLDILGQRGLHCTFFVTGRWVTAFPDAARAIVGAGHEVGNHSLTHPFFSRIGLEGAASEIEQTDRIIRETTGASPRPYFRFPYGDFTAATVAVVAREGYVAYHWSADDPAIPGWIDWAAQHPDEANGGILLLHGRPETIASLPGWLDRLLAQGLQPTTLTDTLR